MLLLPSHLTACLRLLKGLRLLKRLRVRVIERAIERLGQIGQRLVVVVAARAAGCGAIPESAGLNEVGEERGVWTSRTEVRDSNDACANKRCAWSDQN